MARAEKLIKHPQTLTPLLKTAQQTGSQLLVVRALPDMIGVDGGEMLTPGCIGYTLVPQRDGSIRFTFEVSDAFVVETGKALHHPDVGIGQKDGE